MSENIESVSESPLNPVQAVVDNSLLTRMIEIRCSGKVEGIPCNKLLHKLYIYISLPDSLKDEFDINSSSLSQIIKGLEVKIGTETKCNRCKEIWSKLEVL